MSDWIRRQIEALEALQGLTVVRWLGTEMALRESGRDGLPEWEDESIPYLQLVRLDVEFEDAQVARIATYESDDVCGLYRRDDLSELDLLEPSDETSVFRNREVPELPGGSIDRVLVFTAREVIYEVRFWLGGNSIRLVAGEVYENQDRSLTILPMDESILVQLNGSRPNRSLRT